MKSAKPTQGSLLRDISQPIPKNCGAFCACVQPVEQRAVHDSLATLPRVVASFRVEANHPGENRT
jgi:hypothetical protein